MNETTQYILIIEEYKRIAHEYKIIMEEYKAAFLQLSKEKDT